MPLTVILSGNVFWDRNLELFDHIRKDGGERARKLLFDNVDVVREFRHDGLNEVIQRHDLRCVGQSRLGGHTTAVNVYVSYLFNTLGEG